MRTHACAGLWSQIKRAPKAKKVRKTFEVAGPAQGSAALPLDERARQIFQYFKRYNYELVETGDTIRFAGTYAASRGQAAALIFYVFCGARAVQLHVLCCQLSATAGWAASRQVL
jgi:hypothetical protein